MYHVPYNIHLCKPKYFIFSIHLLANQLDNSKKWLKIHCKNRKNTKNAKLAIQVL
jgi:hypothetical protein